MSRLDHPNTSALPILLAEPLHGFRDKRVYSSRERDIPCALPSVPPACWPRPPPAPSSHCRPVRPGPRPWATSPPPRLPPPPRRPPASSPSATTRATCSTSTPTAPPCVRTTWPAASTSAPTGT